MNLADILNRIKVYVIEEIAKQIDERRILPNQISVHYLEFERQFMAQYTGDEFVQHKTIRDLLRWVYQVITATNDPTDVITAIKFISPNLENLDSRTMAAVCQSLILTGEGVVPTINANPNLLPYEIGFDLTSNLVRGQLAYNITDDLWFYRRAGTPDTIVELRAGLGIRIQDVSGLTEALAAANNTYSFANPFLKTQDSEIAAYSESANYNINDYVTYNDLVYLVTGSGLSQWDNSTVYNDGDYVLYNGLIYTCTDESAAGLIPEGSPYWNAYIRNVLPTDTDFWEEQEQVLNYIRLKYDPLTLGIDGLGRLAVLDGVGNFLSTVIPATFTNANLVNNVLIVDHGKETLNVELIVWDNNGKEQRLLNPIVVNENRVTVDLGEPITGVWRYALKYWKNQSIGVYPDPTYALSGHNHNGTYSPVSHDHGNLYAPFSHTHDYAAVNHNHDSQYAALNHNHNSAYAALDHSHLKTNPVIDQTTKAAGLTVAELFVKRDGNVISGYVIAQGNVTNSYLRLGVINAVNNQHIQRFIGAPGISTEVTSAFGRIGISSEIELQFGRANFDFIFPFTFIAEL